MPGIYGIKGELNKIEELHNTMLYNSRYKSHYKNVNNTTSLGISSYKHESFDIIENDKYVIGFEGYYYTEDSNVTTSTKKLLNLFLKYGNNFVKKIDGVFNIFIYSKEKNKLNIFNDWAGNCYLFYYWDGKNFIFSSEMKAILKIVSKKTLNKRGIAQQFMFDHCLYDNTLVNEIKILDPGSILEFKNNELQIEKYFDLKKHFYTLKTKSLYDYIDELYSLFDKTTKRFTNFGNISLPLTGGLDSRLLLHFLLKHNYDLKDIYTIGEKNNEDVIIAKKICNNLNLQHRRHSRNFYQLKKTFENGYRYHDGLLPSIFNNISRQEQILSNDCYYIINYLYNDIVFGEKFAFQNRFLKNNKKTNSQILSKIINFFVQKKPETIIQLINNKDIIRSVFEEIHKNLRNLENLPAVSIFDYFAWTQHCRRWVNIGNSSSRATRYIRRLVPSQDKNIILFAYNLPYNYRQWRYLYRKMIKTKCPVLASFPRAGTGLPLSSNNFLQIVGRAYHKYIKSRFTKNKKTSLEFYQEVVDDKIEDLLFSPKNMTDEIMDVKYKNEIWNNIKNGNDQTKLLHNIINIEIFLREYF